MKYEDYSLAQIGNDLHHSRTEFHWGEGDERELLDELKRRCTNHMSWKHNAKGLLSYHSEAFLREPTAEKFLQLYAMMCLVQDAAPVREDA